MDIPIAKPISIREFGHDEFWLRDLIYDNPSCLHLGDLESVRKEIIQSSGGRLDLLLKNPVDDSMYEVEIMLGATDESHIIRTIEYWDIEKRRWPQRQHYAVLVAESITRRFFNVIQLLSHSIPMIAIQVNLLESEGNNSLHFSKVLDTYEEPDDGTGDGEVFNETYWEKNAQWTIDATRELVGCVGDLFESPTLRFVKNYIAVNILSNNHFWLHKRSGQKSLLCFRIMEDHVDDVSQILDEQNISYTQKRIFFKITCDADFIKNNKDTLRQVAEFVKKTWQK